MSTPPATPAILALADGTLFHGRAIGALGQATGEVVFNTAMSGYQEILSDPSYAGQLVTLTYPHIGNTGVNAEDNEAPAQQAAGLIVRDVPPLPSNWRATASLPQHLAAHGLIAISGIDTRRLTRRLRAQGACNGCIIAGHRDQRDAHETNHKRAPSDARPTPFSPKIAEQAIHAARTAPAMEGTDLVRTVTTRHPYAWPHGAWRLTTDGAVATPPPPPRWRVVACDYGIKHNILRQLCAVGCEVTVVPATFDTEAILAHRPHGVFLSNGPGDPAVCEYAVATVRTLLARRIPLFGICLGHQILALACGAQTVKMPFGHHGANHPVQELASGRVLITSQNHGFCVADTPLPPTLCITHRSLFDGTIQGLAHTESPAFSFQGHPEASPGPHDMRDLFSRFTHLMEKAQASGASLSSPASATSAPAPSASPASATSSPVPAPSSPATPAVAGPTTRPS